MYEELIERLRFQTKFCENTANGNQTKYWLNEAADTIKKLTAVNRDLNKCIEFLKYATERDTDALQAELDHVKAERDYIAKYIPRECYTCKFWRPKTDNPCASTSNRPCNYRLRESWEWKGIES